MTSGAIKYGVPFMLVVIPDPLRVPSSDIFFGGSEVGEFYGTVVVDEEIRTFHVAVDYVVGVEVCKAK